MPPKSLGKSTAKPISSSSHRKTNSASIGNSKPQYFVIDTVLPSHVVNDRSLFVTYSPSKRVHRTAFGTEITIEGTGNVEVRVLASGKPILFTIHDCWHVPSSPHHFLSSLTVTSPSRGHHIILVGRTPRLLFSQQRRLAKPNLPKYVPFARIGGYFVLKFDVPAPVSNLKCNPITVHSATQTPTRLSLQASLHPSHPFAGLSFHKTDLSNSTYSEAALASSKVSAPFEQPVEELVSAAGPAGKEGRGLEIEPMDVVGHVASVHGGASLPSHWGASADIPVDTAPNGVAVLADIVSHGGTNSQGGISVLGNEATSFSGIYGASTLSTSTDSFPLSFPLLPSQALPAHQSLLPTLSQSLSPHPLIPNYLPNGPNHLYLYHHPSHSGHSPHIFEPSSLLSTTFDSKSLQVLSNLQSFNLVFSLSPLHFF